MLPYGKWAFEYLIKHGFISYMVNAKLPNQIRDPSLINSYVVFRVKNLSNTVGLSMKQHISIYATYELLCGAPHNISHTT